MATKKTRKTAAKPAEEKRPPGRPALPDELKRTARISVRTYPEIAEKVARNGTAWLERLIRRAAEGGES